MDLMRTSFTRLELQLTTKMSHTKVFHFKIVVDTSSTLNLKHLFVPVSLLSNELLASCRDVFLFSNFRSNIYRSGPITLPYLTALAPPPETTVAIRVGQVYSIYHIHTKLCDAIYMSLHQAQ